jgi:hypothetical protein
MRTFIMVLLAIVMSIPTVAAQNVNEEDAPALAADSTVDAQAVSCFSTHTYGGANGTPYFKICISRYGNISVIESTPGTNHIGVGEGYVVCSQSQDVLHGYSMGMGEPDGEGFGPPTISQRNGPNTFPLIITRTSLDGVVRLRQEFLWSPIDWTVSVTMIVTNLSSVRKTFYINRYFAAQIGGSADGDRFAMTGNTIFGWDNGATGQGLLLTALRPRAVWPHVEHTEEWVERTGFQCGSSATHTPTPPWTLGTGAVPEGYVGRMQYRTGTINAGASTKLTLQYRRF